MTRRLLPVLFVSLVLLAGWSIARGPEEPDEPPVRLKKKNAANKPETPKPLPDEERKPEKKPAEEPKADSAPEPDGDEAEILRRVSNNLRTAEDRLAKTELDDSTRQVQEDILKDLDRLLQQSNRSQQSQKDQQNQGGQSGQDNQPQGGQQPDKGPGSAGKQSGNKSSRASSGSRQRRERQAGRNSRNEPRQVAKNTEKQPGGKSDQPKDGPGNQDKEAREPGAGGKGREGRPNRAADVYKDVWGHLPESLRAEMDAYFNDRQFMAKYDELIKKYYRSIAEKGRPRR